MKGSINLSIEQSDLEFVVPEVENAKVLKFELVSGIACFLIVFFIMATVIATFLLWHQSRDPRKFFRHRASMVRTNSGFTENNQPLIQSPSGNGSQRRANSGSFVGGAPTNEDSCCDKFLYSFSAIENLGKLSKPLAKQGDEELEVMNGLRVICCTLIILGNSYFYTLRSPIQNIEVL